MTTRAQSPTTHLTSVQAVLATWAPTHGHLMEVLPNGRYCLKKASAATTPPEMEAQLQEAFVREYAPVCYAYAQRYLLDWRTLLAKAARETYWGSSRLSNLAQNYFGIRQMNKEWICESFRFCEVTEHRDPDLAKFSVFPGFEYSLWMFIHTIYARHYLERLPDAGLRVSEAIAFEKQYGVHYWEPVPGQYYRGLLAEPGYTEEEIIATWSGYEINNLCVACDRKSDRDWITRLMNVELRAGDLGFPSAMYGSAGE